MKNPKNPIKTNIFFSLIIKLQEFTDKYIIIQRIIKYLALIDFIIVKVEVLNFSMIKTNTHLKHFKYVQRNCLKIKHEAKFV